MGGSGGRSRGERGWGRRGDVGSAGASPVTSFSISTSLGRQARMRTGPLLRPQDGFPSSQLGRKSSGVESPQSTHCLLLCLPMYTFLLQCEHVKPHGGQKPIPFSTGSLSLATIISGQRMFSLEVGEEGLALRKTRQGQYKQTLVLFLVWGADGVSFQCLESICLSMSDWKAGAASTPPTSWTLFFS